MLAAGELLHRAGVSAIYLIHGTFIGQDAFGLFASLSDAAPSLADTLRGWSKRLVDALAQDNGNFPPRYAEDLQAALRPSGESLLPVHLFHWSSENHHLGRADGAVRLLHELMTRDFSPGSRVLLVAHSHGGNVVAILTNLLAADRELRAAFFRAARCSYRMPIVGCIDAPLWETMRRRVGETDELLPGVQLDVATLGTPVRYGWDIGKCDHLLHFISHRPVPGLPGWQALFPQSPDELWHARHGDFVQQCGIAGTNLPPPIWAWRACDADIRLGRLLQPPDKHSDLLERLRLGMRSHADGVNLLVDYGAGHDTPFQHVFGHAVYTREELQLFHIEQIAQRMVCSSAGLAGDRAVSPGR